MNLQEYLMQNNISKYRLSKDSGVPKSTIMDICAGRSTIDRCSARTVQRLAAALGCSMEGLMQLMSSPTDKTDYMECGLPDFLRDSIKAMCSAWEKVDRGEFYARFDCDFCNLQTDINIAEVDNIISPEQAWYLREKYLGIGRSN